jgi:heptosyltransferase-2
MLVAAREILIVKCEALGDVLRTTCLLEPLRKKGPCRISWLTSPAALPLLKDNPYLKRALTLRLDDPAEAARLGRRLAGRFDLVLSLEEHVAAAKVAQVSCRGSLVGVQVRSGRLVYTPSSARYYDMSLLNGDEDGGLAAANALKAANRLSFAQLWLKTLGLRSSSARPGPVLRLSARDRATARRITKSPAFRGRGPVLAVNPGAGARWPAKQLSEEKAARVLMALGRRFGGPLLLLGGKDELSRNRRIAARAKSLEPRLRLVLPGSLPLRSFAALLELCAALVTTDSLALHLATALQRPAVALVGPTSAAELDFFGRGLALQPPGGCGCFYKPLCARSRPCLDEIAEEDIIAGVLRCLK